jgi:hypothetical protein
MLTEVDLDACTFNGGVAAGLVFFGVDGRVVLMRAYIRPPAVVNLSRYASLGGGLEQ